jgi:hypothetical protein
VLREEAPHLETILVLVLDLAQLRETVQERLSVLVATAGQLGQLVHREGYPTAGRHVANELVEELVKVHAADCGGFLTPVVCVLARVRLVAGHGVLLGLSPYCPQRGFLCAGKSSRLQFGP